jgi:hypothetical protein
LVLVYFSGRISHFWLSQPWTTILVLLPPKYLGLQAVTPLQMSLVFWISFPISKVTHSESRNVSSLTHPGPV